MKDTKYYLIQKSYSKKDRKYIVTHRIPLPTHSYSKSIHLFLEYGHTHMLQGTYYMVDRNGKEYFELFYEIGGHCDMKSIN